MVKEYEVDWNLYYLSQILFDLDSYRFDYEIRSKLNELKSIVDSKLIKDDLGDYNVISERIKLLLCLEEPNKKNRR